MTAARETDASWLPPSQTEWRILREAALSVVDQKRLLDWIKRRCSRTNIPRPRPNVPLLERLPQCDPSYSVCVSLP